MDENKGAPTFPILLAGKEYALRFDLDAQIGVTTTLKVLGLGMQNVTWWRFLDAPYDVAEIMVLLQHGINGAMRYNNTYPPGVRGDKKFLKTDDAKALYEKHINYVYEKANELEPDKDDEDGIDEKAMKFVQDENKRLFDAIEAAARGGSGFRNKKRIAPAKE